VLKSPEYRNTWHAVRRIYATEGAGAFYKGLAASFLGLSHVAIQFPLYEWLKADLRAAWKRRQMQVGERSGGVAFRDDSGRDRKDERSDESFENNHNYRTRSSADIPILIVASSLSKIAATILTYPHEVLRTRMHVQRQANHASLVDTFRLLLREGGVAALYRGLGEST
jgi:solute carrier family 25 folate transporter 32